MRSAKKGAGAATHRAEELRKQKQLTAELNRLQAAINEHFCGVDRYCARKCEIEKALPLPEHDLGRRVDAARSMLQALENALNEHVHLSAGITCGMVLVEQADARARLVAKYGLYSWFFMDEKRHWFMRQKSGDWRHVPLGIIKTCWKEMGVDPQPKTRKGNSEIDLVSLYFSLHAIDLPAELEAMLLAGEKLTFSEIMERSSREFVTRAHSMETMFREFGGTGWRF